jgi:FtsP/CotA-like multicopper oxidase with cupredoxin domain
MDNPHTLHVHGVRKTRENDGVPPTTGITVGPGETHTYTIPANVPGTHLYHCHYQTPRHMDMGMYGILRVDPERYEPADREYFATVGEWDSRLSRQFGGEDIRYDLTNRRPDVFTINGKSAPATLHPETGSPFLVSSGDTDPGIYLVHCHKVDHVRNGSAYPGGMLTGVVYEDAMDTEIFDQLMQYAGYEG